MTGSPAVAVFGSSLTAVGTAEWIDAERVGNSLATSGYAAVTGGYGGTMEAVSKGAAEAGGHVIGVTAPSLFPGRAGANRYVSEEIQASSVTERIGIMLELAVGAIALPGSIGTATELLVAWNTNHIIRSQRATPRPAVAVGPGWRAVAETLVSHVDAFPGDIRIQDTAEEAVSWLLGELGTHLA